MAQAAYDADSKLLRLDFKPERAARVAKGAAEDDRQATAVAPKAAAMVPHRVASLDALRGFNIFWILGGDGVAWALSEMSSGKDGFLPAAGRFIGMQFVHVEWEGFRFYDFIFPLLVFVTGVSIVLSLARLKEREGHSRAHLRVLRRALLLYALGVIYYGGLSHNWPDIRLLGVLQRIALCYLAASMLFLNLNLRGLIVACVALLVGYWALLTFVPVPGVGPATYAADVNLTNWIDEHYLPGRLWYTKWDPEGLLSTLPAIASSLIGVFCGMLLMSERVAPQQKSLWLIGGGAAMVAAGHLWGLQFPVIKSIWTSSFVLVAGGYSMLLLGALYQVMDVWGASRWASAFVWIGANAITLYFLNNVASYQQFATRLVGGDIASFFDRHMAKGAGNLVACAVGLTLAITLARFLYRRKIFLRV